MSTNRNIEVFSAGCPVCEETVALVNRVACPSCDVSVMDMSEPEVARRARHLGIRSLPAIAINGVLTDCCAGRGPEELVIRAAGVGKPR